MAQVLYQLKAVRGATQDATARNGTEMTSKVMIFWSQENKVRLHFIQSGKPT
jgi:hypothetical protein